MGWAFKRSKNVDLPAIFLCLKQERRRQRRKQRSLAWDVALSLSGHFPAAGEVDATLSKNYCRAVQYRSEISGLRTPKTHAQFLRKRVLKNACLNTRLRTFAHIWCECFLLLFTLVYGVLLLLLSTKGKTKGSSNKHHWKYLRRQTNRRYVLGHAHGVDVQSLVIDKRPTVTQIFLLWTECKQKQSQPSILCYISLSRCCLSLLSFAGLARSKEKNLHNALKFSCTAKLFQSQTVQSIPCLRVSRGLISQCKSCQIFVSIVHFPYIKAVDEKNVYKSEENLSASFRGAVIFATRGNQRLWLASLVIKSQQ